MLVYTKDFLSIRYGFNHFLSTFKLASSKVIFVVAPVLFQKVTSGSEDWFDKDKYAFKMLSTRYTFNCVGPKPKIGLESSDISIDILLTTYPPTCLPSYWIPTKSRQSRFKSQTIGSFSKFDRPQLSSSFTYRDSQYFFWKIQTSSVDKFDIQERRSIFKKDFYLSKWTQFNSVYLLKVWY